MSDEKTVFPLAVDAPDTDVTPLTLTMVGDLLTASRESPRKRMIQKIHKSHDDPVHKMFNAMQPGSYIMPHRHVDPHKTETVIVISGALLYVQFTDNGELLSHTLVQPGTETFGIDVAPHIFHTYLPLKPDTLIFEIKDGPYEPAGDKDVPDWAPKEGSDEAEPFLLGLLKQLAELSQAAADKAVAEENAVKS